MQIGFLRSRRSPMVTIRFCGRRKAIWCSGCRAKIGSRSLYYRYTVHHRRNNTTAADLLPSMICWGTILHGAAPPARTRTRFLVRLPLRYPHPVFIASLTPADSARVGHADIRLFDERAGAVRHDRLQHVLPDMLPSDDGVG